MQPPIPTSPLSRPTEFGRKIAKVGLIAGYVALLVCALPRSASAGYAGSGDLKSSPSTVSATTPSPTATQPSPTPTVVATLTPTPTPTPSQITLNDFPDYLNDVGKSMDVEVGRVISFNITEDGVVHQHTATVKEIGVDNIVLTIASDPFDMKVGLGSSTTISVDGQSIRIALVKVSGSTATVTFAQVQAAINQSTPAAASEASTSSLDIPWLIAFVILVSTVLVASLVWWLIRKLDTGDSPYVPLKN